MPGSVARLLRGAPGRWAMGGALAAFAAGLALLTSAPQAAPAAARSQVRPTISASGEHPCAISGGRAYCWGNNNDGELGDGTTVSASVPVAVNTSGALAGKTLIEVTTGDSLDTCALDTAGAAYCWGNGALGLLGDGSTISSTLPVAVQTSGVLAGKTLTQISSGFLQVCAVDTTGVAYCWGFNGSGHLGHPGLSDSDVPVAVDRGGVLAGKRLTQISAGFLQVCAVDSTGLGYCWGNDSYGQLGDGTIASSDVPVAVTSRGVLAGKALTQISTNFYQTCAVDSIGVAFCWGGNPDGELGNSTTKNSDVPVAVNASGVLAGQAMAQISSGDNNTCTLGRIGAAYCWGSNEHGQLGDGTAALGSNVPVAVTSFGSRPPQPPSHVTAKAGNTSAAVSWKGPASLGSGTLTGYMATATPRGRTCSTRKATTCTIRYLVNGTIYRITVITRTSTSHSVASAPATVTPRG